VGPGIGWQHPVGEGRWVSGVGCVVKGCMRWLACGVVCCGVLWRAVVCRGVPWYVIMSCAVLLECAVLCRGVLCGVV
jgi:hypothetical protein